MRITALAIGVAAAIGLICPVPAIARPARCTTGDDDTYACDFKVTDKDGSDQITAPGKPLYILNINEPAKPSGS